MMKAKQPPQAFAPGIAADSDAFARERQDKIARLVEEHGRARVGDLARDFGVSAVTIRKDLLALQGEGRVLRTHGGAVAIEDARSEGPFDLRERLQAVQKLQIGTAAAGMVVDGESIALDASTTSLHVARQLRQRGGWDRLTVVTNGLKIALELAGTPGIAIVMPGGNVRWEAMSLVGSSGLRDLEGVNIQKGFFGAAGFTVDSGLSDATEEEARTKRALVDLAREVIAIADHTKWGRMAYSTFCPTDRINLILTDDLAPAEMVSDLQRLGIEVRRGDAPALSEPGAAQESAR